MTPLPQRKKTAEEIAQLRDQLGVPPSVDASEESSAPQAQAQAPPTASPSTVPERKSAALPAPSYPSRSPQETEKRPQQAEQPKGLPVRKRSAEELEEMRRREMLSQMSVPPPTNIKFMAGHPALIGLGYVAGAAGACSFWIKAYPWVAIIAGSAVALAIAAFLCLRRPVSRHHAGFITAISILVGVFATIHHLPQLQHAS